MVVRSQSRFKLRKTILKCVSGLFPHQVSKERVGIEFERMLFGQNANVVTAFRLLHDLGLFSVVFQPPCDNGGPRPGEWDLGIRAVEIANNLLKENHLFGGATQQEPPPLKQQCTEKGGLSRECFSLSQQTILGMNYPLLFLSAALLPLHGCTFFHEKKKRTMPTAAHVLQNSLRMKNKYMLYVMAILENVDKLKELSRADPPASRVELGLSVRALKDFWCDAIVVACSWELSSDNNGKGEEVVSLDPAKNNSNAILERYISLAYRVEELDLDGVWRTQPLMNGKELMEKLGIPRGPRVGEVLHEQVKWQLSHPNGRANDFEEYFRHNFGGEDSSRVRV